MSKAQNIKESKRVSKKDKHKAFWDHVKADILKIFLLIRYHVDLLIDWVFGYFKDSKRVAIKPGSNSIILESVTSLARKIKKRELKSEEVVQAYIDRIKEVNPILNALVDSRYEAALEEARKIDKDIESGTIQEVDFQEKPFLGVPFTTKESSAVQGLSFTLGIVKRKGRKATFDAEYVELLKKSGAICLGVTNIPQLNLWQETHNPIYGITNNPYNTTRNVGGSSGGEASLLAAGGTAISVGTDIGGSVRIPAFMCGVFGHKPTSNLISTKGTTFRTGKEEQTIVVIGVLTKFAVDLTPILRVLANGNVDKLRLGEPINATNIKIHYLKNPKDFLVSPSRKIMVETFSRENVNVINDKDTDTYKIFWGAYDPRISFRMGVEGRTMVNTGPLTKFADDLTPILKALVGDNCKQLKLDEPVDVSNIKITYLLNPKDPFISPYRETMKKCLPRAVSHFNGVSKTPPEEVEFEGTKYGGKLWSYWMTQESGVNFLKDITDRTGEAKPIIEAIKHFTIGGDYTTSTIYNFINSLLPKPKASWAEAETEKLRKELLEKLGDNGVLLYPSAPFPASYHHASYLRPWNFHFFVIWNVLKFPVTQVPMGLSEDGLPVGIQVVAAPYQDHLCIAVAKELERAFGGYVPPFKTK